MVKQAEWPFVAHMFYKNSLVWTRRYKTAESAFSRATRVLLDRNMPPKTLIEVVQQPCALQVGTILLSVGGKISINYNPSALTIGFINPSQEAA